MLIETLKKLKACKPFRSEDVVNYCITATMFNDGKKTETLDEIGF